MKKNDILQQIHKEKLAHKKSYLEQEEKIAENFNYLQDHWGSLLMQTAFNSFKGFIGLPTSNSSNKKSDNNTQQMGLSVIPMLWEIVQPYLIKYGVDKIKGLFSKKKKKEVE